MKIVKKRWFLYKWVVALVASISLFVAGSYIINKTLIGHESSALSRADQAKTIVGLLCQVDALVATLTAATMVIFGSQSNDEDWYGLSLIEFRRIAGDRVRRLNPTSILILAATVATVAALKPNDASAIILAIIVGIVAARIHRRAATITVYAWKCIPQGSSRERLARIHARSRYRLLASLVVGRRLDP